ncbi:class 1 fructose-bisphosphatase [Compostibacter hankyongensis]|uniref:Fructose-1,6-bisphosphatase class 1 n=1 Tax=Compostibacter hankyongensis TaxID=1007089 RepID=A0ABP8FQD3_9BACT
MNPQRKIMTLGEFTIQELRNFPAATGELSGLLRDIGLAAKRVNVEVSQAGLVDILGDAGRINVQGEDVKKLDIFSNQQFISVLQGGINCAGVGSEENEDILVFDDPLSNQSKYVLLMDPLDGSGNIDVNVSIGTIFSVHRRVTPRGTPCTKDDFLQPGNCVVAAGYIIYGSSTILVYATRRGVNGFTLDPSIGEFCLSHPNLKCPPDGNIFSVNLGNMEKYDEPVKEYVRYCMHRDPGSGRPYTHRYIGSMVADIHRNLIKGGIFIYPGTSDRPSGKLRLLYECNPMAFIVEVAGGKALTAAGQRVLDVQPTAIHQRTPMYIGSRHMMEKLEDFLTNAM